ncbi:MAG TPA: diacylglycerol kinase family protein [Anaerolineae bacterium]|nr:diacylglycerol kinase family protein [Anaerolineae bacterium]
MSSSASPGSRFASFHYAFEGIAHVLRTQPNARIHAAISIAVVLAGLWLGLDRVEWAILVVTMAVVWVAEFVNTAVEAAVDLATEERHPLAKTAKDAAAGGVLAAAILAVIVGLLILGPPLWARLFGR